MKLVIPCRTMDPDTWFPVGTSGPALMQEEVAKSFCHACPIEQQCLASALILGSDYGVWGGMSASERRNLTPQQKNSIIYANRSDSANSSDRTPLARVLASS